jgi:response regulator RpfG family c-di-GMP phosphodiesterase
MPSWAFWTILAILIWAALASFLIVAVGRVSRPRDLGKLEPVVRPRTKAGDARSERIRPTSVLVVDDDPGLRALLRASFEVAHIDVEEADGALAAKDAIAARLPDVIVLDVAMPGMDGITFCRALRADPFTRAVPVVLLTGDAISASAGEAAGADALVRKPFSPLALLAAIEGLAVRRYSRPTVVQPERSGEEQLLLYAQDFRRLLELERGQRALLQQAYRETAVALARALETKDGHTPAHCERVRRYATELTSAADPDLLKETGLEYGFILHDVGKLAIPDTVLSKSGELTDSERRLLEAHPVLGEQMIHEAALLHGPGAQVVRSHHERWDGNGYPDGLAGDAIPLSARIFAIADTLDALTSDRPHRPAWTWEHAVGEIASNGGSQFDPALVTLVREREQPLRRIYYELSATTAAET